jgi:hypothetical protein
MADCNPWELVANEPCLNGFNSVLLDAVALQLMCAIANNGGLGKDFRITDDGKTRVDDAGDKIKVNP